MNVNFWFEREIRRWPQRTVSVYCPPVDTVDTFSAGTTSSSLIKVPVNCLSVPSAGEQNISPLIDFIYF